MTHTACPPLLTLSLSNLKVEGGKSSLLHLTKTTRFWSISNCLVLEGSRAYDLLLNSPEYCLFPKPKISSQSRKCVSLWKKCSSHCNHRHSNTERNAFLIHINSGVNPGMQFGPLSGSAMSSIAVRTVSVAGSLSTFSLRPKANYSRERKQMSTPAGWNARTRFSVRRYVKAYRDGKIIILILWLQEYSSRSAMAWSHSFAFTLVSRCTHCLVSNHCYCRLCLHFSVMSLLHPFKEMKSSSSLPSPHTLLWLDTFSIA